MLMRLAMGETLIVRGDALSIKLIGTGRSDPTQNLLVLIMRLVSED